jgi:hypothetical protein
VETKSPLTFLIYLKQFVTLPIASFPKFTGRKIGQRAEKRAEIPTEILSGLQTDSSTNLGAIDECYDF